MIISNLHLIAYLLKKNKCRDKYVSPDNMEEEDFNECYDFVNQNKWYFYDLFAKHLSKKFANAKLSN